MQSGSQISFYIKELRQSDVKLRAKLEKSEALTTLCRYRTINVKPRALRHLDGQLKSACSGH